MEGEVVAHFFNPSTEREETGGTPELGASLMYIVTHLKTNKNLKFKGGEREIEEI